MVPSRYPVRPILPVYGCRGRLVLSIPLWPYYTTRSHARGCPLSYNKGNKKGNNLVPRRSVRRETQLAMDGINSFGEWLRRRRRALDLTQAELADRAGCVTGTIKSIEANARRPS